MSYMISMKAELRFHLEHAPTEAQIDALVRSAISEGCPTLLVQDQTETAMMDVGSAADINVINDIGITEIDVWVDGDVNFVYDIDRDVYTK